MTTTTANPARSARCLRCGRALHSAKSLTDGMGRTCKAKVSAAAVRFAAKPAQVAKAAELIEVGGIVPIRALRHGGRAYRTVSSKGDTTYLTAARNCSCPAGLRGRDCYHMLSVQILSAA